MSASQKPFRAVIVGGGLVALTAAHIFTKAGIDFVILERHENLLPEIGSLLNIWPPTFRVLDQLGLLDAMEPVLNVVNRGVSMSAEDGSIFSELDPDVLFVKHHGYGVRVAHRPYFIEVLYQTLPDSAKERIKLKKHVVNVNVSDDGVSVECADGTVEEGSIIIGADGVHSRVRQCMQALAAGKLIPDRSQPSKSPYLTTFRMLFGNIPVPPGQDTGVNYEGASERVSTQLITGKSQAWIGIYEAIDKPTSERVRYTEQDKEKILEKWGHLYAAPGLRIRDAFALQDGTPGLISLEEGHVDNWKWKRIVLMGDAIRKLEPHAGLGYNSGVIDVIVLANKLRRLLRTDPSPTTEALEAVFAKYQADRKKDEPKIDNMSRRRARTTAWLSPMNKIMTKYIAPHTNLAYYSMRYIMAPIISRVPVLEWLEEKSLPETLQVPYLYYPVPEGAELEDPVKRSRSSSYGLSILTGTAALAALAAVGFQYYRKLH
ncbi:FAD/NAD(P)-binding domain-containing protein [Hypoxylon rubiginosum]|uniref:FAD/NAD(P)-binding domain-containing protein n=1 Tax=Hypoxylon rubiginosum TaxID=110542 RepID=A0ACC0CXN1_9PEZI|nr:FAD/NAD(P)-binding domain-containing protein [Hypoxylon rubiginosum]